MDRQEILCMNCFAVLHNSDSPCHVCGWDNSTSQITHGLEYKKILNGRYIVGRVKSVNGEGITYSAYDRQKRHPVEIKEFFPFSISSRNPEDNTIIPNEGFETDFENYLDQFIELSKNISRLKEVSVIHSIIDIFEENYTAYAVYEFVNSVSLKTYVETNGVLSWNTAHSMFLPVLTALGLINSLGVTHLGIAPETLRVTAENKLLITGFAIHAIRTAKSQLPKEIFAGSASVEQYAQNVGCTETSDVYSFTASLLFAVTGALPDAAPRRLKDPKLMIAKEFIRDLPPYIITALANALQVKPDDRTASFERLKVELAAAPTQIITASSTQAIRSLPETETDIPQGYSIPSFAWLIGSALITVIAIVIVAVFWLNRSSNKQNNNQNSSGIIAQQIEVPNILNANYDEVQNKINNGEYKFILQISSRSYTDTVEENHIITQSPNPGEYMVEGGKILITVSRGKEERTLPEISGMSFTEIYDNLIANGFVVIRKDEPSDEIELGNVIRYEGFEQGAKLTHGSEITVVVSTGSP